MNREEIIKRLITEKEMNLKEFAKKINIPYTTLHSILNRGIGNASVDNIIKICKGLGITVEELNNSYILDNKDLLVSEDKETKYGFENDKIKILLHEARGMNEEDLERIIKIAKAWNEEKDID